MPSYRNGKSLLEKVTELEESFSLFLFLYEKGFLNYSVYLTSKTMRSVQKLLNNIREEGVEAEIFLNMALKNKMKHLKPDQNFVHKMAKECERGNVKSSAEDYYSVLIRTRQNLYLLKKEIKRIYKLENPILSTFKKNKKRVQLGIVSAIVGLIVIGWLSYVHHFTKGLRGEYFSDSKLKKYSQTRIDRVIDFQWRRKGPFDDFNVDSFSVRWTGYLHIPEAGEYELITLSDDGVRLWIGDKLVIENWTRHYPVYDYAQLKLPEGYHPIKIEYYERSLDATFQLYWKKEFDIEKVLIPKSQLIPNRRHLKKSIPIITADSTNGDEQQ